MQCVKRAVGDARDTLAPAHFRFSGGGAAGDEESDRCALGVP